MERCPKNSQYRSIWRNSHIVLWMCYVLINVPRILASCQGVNISVSLYPEGMIAIPYGEPLEIFCIAENNYTANDVEFFYLWNHVDSEIVNRTTRRLYIEHIEKQVSVYYCKNNVTKKSCTSRVLVDSSPSNITDFSCISKNIEELNCTWTSRENISKTNFSLTFLVNNKASIPCKIMTDGKRYLCNWNTASRPRYRQYVEQLNFQLTSCNFLGCNVQTFTINHFSSVKPDPPANLKVMKQMPHGVLLSWTIPNNIVDFLACPIVHRIEYRIPKIDRTDYFRSVDTSILKSNISNNSNPNKKSYTFLLSNLPYAHMSYEVRIFIKPETADDSFWSDFSYVLFTTASERPQRPPDTMVGAFEQSVYNDKRVLNIYWKQLDENEETGANCRYKVVVKQDFKNEVTALSEKNKNSVTISDVSLEAADVYIWAVNEFGSSDNSSHLYIPPERDTDSLQVYSFSKVSFDNGTYKLSWVEVADVDSYTLFWCNYTPGGCIRPMDFIRLEPQRNTYLINLPKENRYHFALGANRGNNTSGMVWARFRFRHYHK